MTARRSATLRGWPRVVETIAGLAPQPHTRHRSRRAATMNPVYRVVILDDHPVVRQGMTAQLAEAPEISVVGSFGTARELIQGLQALDGQVEAALIDYSLGPSDVDGLNLLRALRSRHRNLPVLVFSAHRNASAVLLMLEAGILGFVSKSADSGELIAATKAVCEGRRYIQADVEAEIQAISGFHPTGIQGSIDRRADLTAREHEVLRCVLDGMSTSEIANKYQRAPSTISTQKKAAYAKLGVRSDAELFNLRHLIG